MKIIFLEAVQDHGGARKSTLELAKRLQEKEIEVLIVDFYGSNAEFVADAEEKKLPIEIIEKRDNPFIIKHTNKAKQLYNYALFFLQMRRIKKGFIKICQEFSPDYIIVNNRKTLSLIPKSNHYKIVFFARGWFINQQIFKVDKMLMKKKVDMYMAVSQSTRQALYCSEMETLENIHVVKNGIDLNYLQQYASDKFENFTIIHSGGFLPDKGQHICIEVAKRLKQNKLKFQFILTGKIYEEEESQQYYASIKSTIEKENLNDFIQIVDGRNNILDILAKSHILMHSSATEGLPRVVMEAMALKTFVIANPVGGVTDFVLDKFTGFIADYNNVPDYVEKITYLYHHKDFMNVITEHAYELIKNTYTPESQIEDFINATIQR